MGERAERGVRLGQVVAKRASHAGWLGSARELQQSRLVRGRRAEGEEGA